MPVAVTREADEVVIRIKRGSRSLGFARFLEAAADGLENGKIIPTNPHHGGSIVKAADQVREIAKNVRTHSQ